MTEKIKLWKCEECDESPCLAAELTGEKPTECLFGDGSEEKNWQETNEFEITRKVKTPAEKFACAMDAGVLPTINFSKIKKEAEVFIFESIADLGKWLKSHVEPVKTPNCSICKWKIETLDLRIATGKETYEVECGAQGYFSVHEKYNSKECQTLFEPAT